MNPFLILVPTGVHLHADKRSEFRQKTKREQATRSDLLFPLFFPVGITPGCILKRELFILKPAAFTKYSPFCEEIAEAIADTVK